MHSRIHLLWAYLHADVRLHRRHAIVPRRAIRPHGYDGLIISTVDEALGDVNLSHVISTLTDNLFDACMARHTTRHACDAGDWTFAAARVSR